ncbi:MAG: hypothetical protein M3Y37_08125, partial [Chloroflexota bacterium]|nr:hypothetical protein [Chloroflexota bacterium]
LIGASPDEVAAAAERAIEPYLGWLHEGELLPADVHAEPLEVAESLPVHGNIRPLFTLDRIHPAEDAIELALAVGRASLSDLLFVRDDVPRERLAEADRLLRQLAEADRWFATRIAEASGLPFQSLEDELIQSASLFEETVDLAAQSGQTAIRPIDGEEWTLAKALRRRTGHLRRHLPVLMALLEPADE